MNKIQFPLKIAMVYVVSNPKNVIPIKEIAQSE